MFVLMFPDCFGSEECQVGGRSSAQWSSVPVKNFKVVFTKKVRSDDDIHVWPSGYIDVFCWENERGSCDIWTNSSKMPQLMTNFFFTALGFKNQNCMLIPITMKKFQKSILKSGTQNLIKIPTFVTILVHVYRKKNYHKVFWL